MAIATTSFQTGTTDLQLAFPALPLLLSGTVTQLDAQDPTEANETTNLIEQGDPVNVVVNWRLDGLLTPFVGGTWELELFIDSIGEGATAGSLGTQTQPVLAGPPPVVQGPVTFPVGGGTILTGVYQLVVTINHRAAGLPPGSLTEMVGYVQSTPIKVTPAVVEAPGPFG